MRSARGRLDVVASCCIRGGAHGHLVVGELLQTADGRFLRRCWADGLTAEPPLEEVQLAIDLCAELQALRRAPALAREGADRWAELEARVGGERLTVRYPRPLIGDSQTDHPVDRLYDAIFGWP